MLGVGAPNPERRGKEPEKGAQQRGGFLWGRSSHPTHGTRGPAAPCCPKHQNLPKKHRQRRILEAAASRRLVILPARSTWAPCVHTHTHTQTRTDTRTSATQPPGRAPLPRGKCSRASSPGPSCVPRPRRGLFPHGGGRGGLGFGVAVSGDVPELWEPPPGAVGWSWRGQRGEEGEVGALPRGWGQLWVPRARHPLCLPHLQHRCWVCSEPSAGADPAQCMSVCPGRPLLSPKSSTALHRREGCWHGTAQGPPAAQGGHRLGKGRWGHPTKHSIAPCRGTPRGHGHPEGQPRERRRS